MDSLPIISLIVSVVLVVGGGIISYVLSNLNDKINQVEKNFNQSAQQHEHHSDAIDSQRKKDIDDLYEKFEGVSVEMNEIRSNYLTRFETMTNILHSLDKKITEDIAVLRSESSDNFHQLRESITSLSGEINAMLVGKADANSCLMHSKYVTERYSDLEKRLIVIETKQLTSK